MSNDESITLGQVTVPSGTLFLVDPSMLDLWCHDQPPEFPEVADVSPEQRADINAGADLHLVGEAAERVGTALDRSDLPAWIWDVPASAIDQDVAAIEAHPAAEGASLDVEVVRPRVPHLSRAKMVVDAFGGGEVQFQGVWSAAVGGLPSDRPLRVSAQRHRDSEFEGRWQRVCIEVGQAEVVSSVRSGRVMVDAARILLADLESVGAWDLRWVVDGQADLVFWGRDAEAVATEVDAPSLEDENFGWLDLPLAEARTLGLRIQELRRSRDDLRFAFDFRPHNIQWQLLQQVRGGETESGVAALGSSQCTLFMTTWGDGIFDVFRDLDAAGQLVQVRLELATDERLELMRGVQERYFGPLAQLAIVSKRALEHGANFVHRDPPRNEDDSGWCLLHGDESRAYLEDSSNAVLMPLRDLVDRDPEFAAIVDADLGTEWERPRPGTPFEQLDPEELPE